MAREELRLSVAATKRLEHFWILQVVLGIHLSLYHAQHAIPARVGKSRQVELLDVLPVAVIAWLGEVFCSRIDIESVGKSFANSVNVAPCPRRSLEHNNVMSALHQFVGAR